MIEKKIKIILDTDNGDDIDDLFTIYAMLGCEDIEVVGIVCSYLNTPLRARQVRHVLHLKGREDIPVYAGCGNSIHGYHDRPTNLVFWQYSEVLDSKDYYRDYDNDNGEMAIDFMIDSAKKYKDELYICSIGPECTIGRAIKKDKEAFKYTHFYIMGGAFFKHESEWNIECDVEGAKIVMGSGLDVNFCGLDVTRSTTMPEESYKRFINIDKDQYINYLVETTKLWCNHANRYPTLHDPLTFISIGEDFVNYEEVSVKMLDDEKIKKVYFEADNSDNSYHIKAAKNFKRLDYFEKIYELIGIKKEIIGG